MTTTTHLFFYTYLVIISIKMPLTDETREAFGFVCEKLRDFLLKREIKDTHWPVVVAGQVVNQITLLVDLVVE